MITGPSVVVSARVASMIAPQLVEMLRRYRVVDGGVPDAEVTATVEAITRLGRAWRESMTPPPLDPSADIGTSGTSRNAAAEASAMIGLVSVADAARYLGVTERAVRARCQRGTIAAERIGRAWLIDLTDEPAPNERNTP
jgi:excisionase family DNA binding protein